MPGCCAAAAAAAPAAAVAAPAAVSASAVVAAVAVAAAAVTAQHATLVRADLPNDAMRVKRCGGAHVQNIDSLETAAGLPADKLVAAHGNVDSATCIDTGRPVPVEELKRALGVGSRGSDSAHRDSDSDDDHDDDDKYNDDKGWMELAVRHGGLVKPDIVFFGEALPARFGCLVGPDLGAADLLVVAGTSLAVRPVASLVDWLPERVPRVLVNRELVGGFDDFDDDLAVGSAHRDTFVKGDADDVFWAVAAELGWASELEALVRLGAAGTTEPK